MHTASGIVGGPPRETKLFMNPMIRKLNRVQEQSLEHPATYGGIAAKTCFFMVLIAAGIAGYFVFHPMLAVGSFIEYDGGNIYLGEAVIALVAFLVSCFAPLLAFLIRPLIPVLGTLYCLSVGYTITWLATIYGAEYTEMIYLALGITILLVGLMAVLYASGIVKVNHKFRSVVTILFFAAILSGVVGFLLSLIPALSGLMAVLRENAVIGIVGGVLYVIIACLFLLVDFDTVKHTVQDHLPKKYEWTAAFALAYTVIYLFFKVLHLLMRAKGGSSRSN